MCNEVIFRGRYLHTIEDLQSALGGGEIVPNRQCGYADDDLLPHCCLCPVDLAQTAAKNGLRLWPSSEGEGVWILSDDDSDPRKIGIAIDTVCDALSKSGDWARALRLADDAAESLICTEGHNTEGRQWVLYPEQLAADPYLEDCIAHLEWRGIAKAVREDGRATVIFEEKP